MADISDDRLMPLAAAMGMNISLGSAMPAAAPSPLRFNERRASVGAGATGAAPVAMSATESVVALLGMMLDSLERIVNVLVETFNQNKEIADADLRARAEAAQDAKEASAFPVGEDSVEALEEEDTAPQPVAAKEKKGGFFAPIIALLATGIGGIVASLTTFFAPVLAGLSSLGTAFATFALPVTAIIAALWAAYEIFKRLDFTAILKPLAKYFNILKDIVMTVGQVAFKGIMVAGKALVEILGLAYIGFQKLFDVIAMVLQPVLDGLALALTPLVDMFGEWWEATKPLVVGLGDFFDTLLRADSVILELGRVLKNAFLRLVANIWNAIAGALPSFLGMDKMEVPEKYTVTTKEDAPKEDAPREDAPREDAPSEEYTTPPPEAGTVGPLINQPIPDTGGSQTQFGGYIPGHLFDDAGPAPVIASVDIPPKVAPLDHAPAAAAAENYASGPTGMTPTKQMIMDHEGVRHTPYKDSLGLWTVGVGHLIGDGKTLPDSMNRTFSDAEVFDMFNEDYEHHAKFARQIPGYNKLGTPAQGALEDLTFNMGPVWYKKWPILTGQLSAGDNQGAAQNLRGSKWYRQVGPGRGNKISGLIAADRGASSPSPVVSGNRVSPFSDTVGGRGAGRGSASPSIVAGGLAPSTTLPLSTAPSFAAQDAVTVPMQLPSAPGLSRSGAGVATATAKHASQTEAAPMIVANVGGPSGPAAPAAPPQLMPFPIVVNAHSEDQTLRALQSVNNV